MTGTARHNQSARCSFLSCCLCCCCCCCRNLGEVPCRCGRIQGPCWKPCTAAWMHCGSMGALCSMQRAPCARGQQHAKVVDGATPGRARAVWMFVPMRGAGVAGGAEGSSANAVNAARYPYVGMWVRSYCPALRPALFCCVLLPILRTLMLLNHEALCLTPFRAATDTQSECSHAPVFVMSDIFFFGWHCQVICWLLAQCKGVVL